MALDLLDKGEKLSCFLLGVNCRSRYKMVAVGVFDLRR